MNWVAKRKEEFRLLHDYSSELESRLGIAIHALTDIAAGLVQSDHPEEWSWETKTRVDAALTLEKLSKRLNKPYTSW